MNISAIALTFVGVISVSAVAVAAPTKSDMAKTPKSAAAAASSPSDKPLGLSVVGEDEAPVGLYITPWKQDVPKTSLAQPHRVLEEEPVPIDRQVFHRQIEYYDAIKRWRKEQLAKQEQPLTGLPEKAENTHSH